MNGMTCKAKIAGAGDVQALAINVEAVNRPIVLSLRPERVQPNPTPGTLPNVFSAEIAEVIYLGDHVRTRLSPYGHDDFVIKLPNSEGPVQLEPGAAITSAGKRKIVGPSTRTDDGPGG